MYYIVISELLTKIIKNILYIILNYVLKSRSNPVSAITIVYFVGNNGAVVIQDFWLFVKNVKQDWLCIQSICKYTFYIPMSLRIILIIF